MPRARGDDGQFTDWYKARFWARVGPPDERGCRVGGFGPRAHRRAYEMAYGPIPPGLYVCHRCDNPPRCEPTHLWLGTAADNAHDRDMKGRQKPFLGQHSFETRAKMSASRTGLRHKPETRARMRAAWPDAKRKAKAEELRKRWALMSPDERAARRPKPGRGPYRVKTDS